MKKILFILLLLPFLMSTTCEKESNSCHKRIGFTNNSTKTIYVTFSKDYPETVDTHIWIGNNCLIESNSYSNQALETKDCFEEYFKNEKIIVYVIDKVVAETQYVNIIKNKLYLKKYELSLEELDTMKWQIVY